MKNLRPLFLLIFFAQSLPAQSTFTKPSEAYEFAQRPMTEWMAAIHSGKEPATRTAPRGLVRQRSSELCPSFPLESVSGEELYWLAKLCEQDQQKSLLAVARYLAGGELAHRAEARLLLAMCQLRVTGNWESAWGTFRTMLQEDPIPPAQPMPDIAISLDAAIDDEARTNPKKALEWSKERYALLVERTHNGKPDVPRVSYSYVLSAGSDLVHRLYLTGEAEQAVKILDEMNNFVQSHPNEAMGSWGAEDLHWANLEMHPAPMITVLKVLGNSPNFDLIQKGRVEIISFFFLGCAPCMDELPHLNDLQKRYGNKKLLVTDVTTYTANSYLTPPTHSNIEVSLEKARLENAREISFVIASEETLKSYDVNAFPVVVVVDKLGRVRYVGRVKDFDDDDSAGVVIHKVMEE